MKSLTASVWIGCPRPEIFDLFGTSEGLKSWFAADAEVILTAGMFNFWGDHTPEEPVQFSGHTRLVRVKAPESLCFGWRLRSVESMVTVDLEERDGGTEVKVKHEGLQPRAENAGVMHDFWYAALENLRLRALTGHPQQMPDYRQRMGSELTLHMEVQGTPEQIFDKIANPEQIDRYFGRGSVVEPHVGGRISFGWDEGGPRTITAFEPAKKLAYRWQYGPERETEVTWTLAPRGDGPGGATAVELRHAGWHPSFESEAYRVGWHSFLVVVKAMVELGSAWQVVRIEGVQHGDV
jgi:uncharacterized protein YndB with AHSA1/START domain